MSLLQKKINVYIWFEIFLTTLSSEFRTTCLNKIKREDNQKLKTQLKIPLRIVWEMLKN